MLKNFMLFFILSTLSLGKGVDLEFPSTHQATLQEEGQVDRLEISLVGDILLDGRIVGHMDKYGYHYPYEDVKDYFLKDDISIGNLETSITSRGEKWPDKFFNFRSHPKNVTFMKEAGIDLVSLANNHSLDYGYVGLRDTLKHLRDGGIKVVGAGENRQEAMQAVIIEKNNTRIGVLGFSRVVPDVGWWATANRPGLAGAYDGQMPGALKAIEELRPQVDIIIINIHWGLELHEEPREIDVIAARKMIDSGADVIVGHHPHVLQGIEIYKDKPIFYSLGNFIFGSKDKLTSNTMIAQLRIQDRKLDSIEIIPFNIVGSRPQKVDQELRQEKLNYLAELSSRFKTSIGSDGIIQIGK